jgi:CRISP-associated protein Cas1
MPTLYLTEAYALVRRDSEDTLLVQIPERRAKDGVPATRARQEHIPLIKIDEVVVVGEITLTASAIHLLLDRNVEITFLGHFGQFKGRLSPPFSRNAILRQAQYRAHQDMTMRCELARRFVIGKLSNQRQRLVRAHRTDPQDEMNRSIKQMTDLLADLAALSVSQPFKTKTVASGNQSIAGTPLETILGMEGGR